MFKVGVHIVIGSRDGFKEFLDETAGILSVVKAVDDVGALVEAKHKSPGCLTVAAFEALRSGVDPLRPADQEATAWWVRFKAKLSQLSNTERSAVDVWETNNENPGNWKFWSDWSIDLMHRADREGLKLCIFNHSTGTPPLMTDSDGPAALAEIVRAYKVAKSGGHYLGLHEYGGVGAPALVQLAAIARNMLTGSPAYGTLQESVRRGHALRYRRLYNDALIPAGADCRLIITEAGQDGGAEYIGLPTFIDDFRWYAGELARDQYVVGCCAWTLGRWAGANFEAALPELADLIVEGSTMTPDPRLSYRSRIIVVHPRAYRREEFYHVAGEFGHTVVTSLDDAGRGHSLIGLSREVWVVGRPDWPDDPVAWLDRYYPGADIFSADMTPEALRAWLAVNPIGTWPPRAPGIPPTPPPFTLVSPVKGIPLVITDPFDTPRPYANKKHEGVDMRAFDFAAGKAVEVIAPADGVVSLARDPDTVAERDYGKFVILSHGNSYYTLLAHLARIDVHAGQPVKRGETVIGLAGQTDTDSIHLHLTLLHPSGLAGYYIHPLSPGTRVLNPATFFEESGGVERVIVRGLGVGEVGDFQTVDWDVLRTATGLTGVKLWTASPVVDLARKLVSGSAGRPLQAANLMVRIHCTPATAQHQTGAAVFAENKATMAALISLLSGRVKFEIHNEPNVVTDGWRGPHWSSASEFCRSWYEPFARASRAAFGPDAQLIFPGLGPSYGEDDAGRSVFNWFPEIRRLVDAGLVDGVGWHAYWGDAAQMRQRDHGLYVEHFIAARLGVPLWGTEFSNNQTRDSNAEKGRQYNEYYALLRDYPDVAGAYAFALRWGQHAERREGWSQAGVVSDIARAVR